MPRASKNVKIRYVIKIRKIQKLEKSLMSAADSYIEVEPKHVIERRFFAK